MVVHSADVSAEGERVRASAGRLIERVREIGTPCSDHETPFILVWLEWAGYVDMCCGVFHSGDTIEVTQGEISGYLVDKYTEIVITELV